MTEKQLFGIVKGHREHIADHTGRLYSDSEVANLLNELSEENEQLKMHMESVKAHLEGGHTKKAIERLKIIDIR